jgi:hypothetical protein
MAWPTLLRKNASGMTWSTMKPDQVTETKPDPVVDFARPQTTI